MFGICNKSEHLSDYVCSQPRDTGVRCSSSTISRYFFNVDLKTCQRFEYNGCEGNRNNFATLDQCQNYCLSSGDVTVLSLYVYVVQ